MTEQEAIRAFGENCKWLRKRIRELEEQIEGLNEQLGRKSEAQREFDRQDQMVFSLVHGQRVPLSEGCIHVVLR
ncbi:MAG: hypothetical protein ACI3XG_02825 [Faecousia sp.]